jgi:hypothetical protein
MLNFFLIIFFTYICFVNASLTLHVGLILLVFFTIIFKIKSNIFQKIFLALITFIVLISILNNSIIKTKLIDLNLSFNFKVVDKKKSTEDTDQTIAVGTRFLLVEDIGDTNNDDGADAWKSTGVADLVAQANDIIEWTGSAWSIIFNSSQETDALVWQTNIYTGVQYLWNGVSWVKSFEGEYTSDKWKIVL